MSDARRVVVIGAGFGGLSVVRALRKADVAINGVEMAGAIAEIARYTLRNDFRLIDPTRARVVLIEAGPRLLPALPQNLSNYAANALRGMGVEVQLGVAVTACDADGATTASGRIEAATLIWAAGVRASDAAAWIGVTPDRHGRIEVGADLTVPHHPEISVIGDTAAVVQPDGSTVPGVAPAAKQMGNFVGRRLAGRGKGRADVFRYRDQGDLATIGRKAAVVRLGRLHLTGFPAWLFWSVAHIFFLVTLRDRFVVSINWLWSYLTFQRSARVVTRPGDDRARL
jgi:NADH dehydrogenase